MFLSSIKNRAAKYLNYRRKIDFPLPCFGPVTFEDENHVPRINLLLPGVLGDSYAGGIETALVFCCTLAKRLNAEVRILNFGARADNSLIQKLLVERYDLDPNTNISTDVIGGSFPVGFRQSDVWLCTYWTTAFALQSLFDTNSLFRLNSRAPLLYLIQDYEPNFFPVSTMSVLAASTYDWSGSSVAIFNSKSLSDYYFARHAVPKHSFIFPPLANIELCKRIDARFGNMTRKNRILVYGRPNKPRNAFGLLLEALRIWSELDDARSWEVISVGEMHRPIPLGNGIELRSAGFLTLDHYAKLLCSCRIGVSLMLSPHPSYPPFEMALGGLHVITNNYECRVWEKYDLIHAIDDISVQSIVERLAVLTKQVKNIEPTRSYFGEDMGSHLDIEFVSDSICEILANV